MGLRERLSNLVRGNRHARDIDDELAFHIEMRVEENLQAGMPAAEARRDAERRFGNRLLAAERTRDADVVGWIDRVSQDLRHSARAVRSSRGISIVLVASVALGIGANTAMFTLLYSLLMRPLPVHDPGSLYGVTLGQPCACGWVERDDALNYALWSELRREQRVFAGLFAYSPKTLDLSSGREVRLISGAYASADMWSVLGVTPLAGRTFTAADESGGAASAVVVIGETLWESEYGRQLDVLGRPLVIGGRPFTIIGVVPRPFFGMYVGDRVEVYLPLEASPLLESENPLEYGRWWWLTVVGRLQPGMEPAAAQQQLTALAPLAMQRTLPAEFPQQQIPVYLRQQFELAPAGTGLSEMRAGLTRPLLIASGLLGTLLLLACVNIATLQLSRGLTRQREFALRVALGASPARLGTQVFLENLLTAAAGAALGIVLALPLAALLASLYSTDLAPLDVDLRPDGSVLLFAVAVMMTTAVLFGSAPALQAMRTNAHGTLKAVRATTAGSSLRQWLLALQVALAVVLTTGALLFGTTLRNLASEAGRFRPANVLVLQIDTRRTGMTADERVAFYGATLERLATLPEAASVAASYVIPLDGSTWQRDVRVGVAGATAAAHVYVHVVTPSFFETYNTPVVEGRALLPSDSRGAPPVALVNRAFVHQVLGGAPFTGVRVTGSDGARPDAEIVGVVADAKYRNLRAAVPPTIYMALAQDSAPPVSIALALRARGAGPEAAEAIRRTMASLDSDVAYLMRPFDSYIANSIVKERAMAVVATLFGALAILLACAGVYGLAAYSVTQRRAEIGLRMVLGAGAGRVVGQVFGRMGLVVLGGIVLGAIGAAWTSRLAEAVLFDVSAGSLWIHVSAAALLLVAAAVAILGPSVSAARVDPLQALRTDA
jgi:predicted permease